MDVRRLETSVGPFSLVPLELDVASREDLLTQVATTLLEWGWVDPGFVSALLQRERRFPTGLALATGALALPHTDAKYCRRNGIVVAHNARSVTFRRLDNPDAEVSVNMVITLVIVEPQQQVPMLSRLSESLTDPTFVAALKAGGGAASLAEVLEALLFVKGREQ